MSSETWGEAHRMMAAYGEDAAIMAAMQADKALDDGDAEGFHAWKRVVRAINSLYASGGNAPAH